MGLPEKPRSGRRLVGELGGVLAHWAGAQVRICLILAALYAVGFALLHVPVWPFFALLCGFAHAIPMFGALVAILITAAFTWISQGFYPALGTVLIFAAASGLEGFYLTPRIMGRHLQLSPWLVFFGVILASSMFGFVGVLLAVPVMAIAAVIWKFYSRSHSAHPE